MKDSLTYRNASPFAQQQPILEKLFLPSDLMMKSTELGACNLCSDRLEGKAFNQCLKSASQSKTCPARNCNQVEERSTWGNTAAFLRVYKWHTRTKIHLIDITVDKTTPALCIVKVLLDQLVTHRWWFTGPTGNALLIRFQITRFQIFYDFKNSFPECT